MSRFIFFATVALSGFATAHAEEEACPEGKQHYRTNVRHIESGGIGYEDGYTTLEVFLASDPSLWTVTPFLDARGHVFNNGKWAANAGVGLRTLWGNRVYGINAYYDYRNAGRFKSNQIGVGLETLGERFDFRINGYWPIGNKTCSPDAATFVTFSGNYMLVSQKYQFAMKGADAEFGVHFGKSEWFDFYAAAGPYYFTEKLDPSTWGGKARIAGSFKDLLTLEISDSYDKTFHNKFQGQLSLGFSFGPKSKVKKQGPSCDVANTLNTRMLQPVGRQEIIVIDATSRAIDPATGLPYFFVFVDNTSHSNGTYESPYHNFAQVEANSSPNNIIYVFPGNGTTTGMDSGIFLKANQKFWGSGISHSLQTSQGTISIPAHSSSSPTITNTNIDTDGNAITLATNNAISGFTITSAMNDAIYGVESQNLEVSSCTFRNTTTYTIAASFSGDASISLTDNQFVDNVNGVFLDLLDGTFTVACSNNTFTGQTSVSSIPLEISAIDNTFVANIENNVFGNNITGSIRFDLDNVVNADITVLNNTMTNNETGSQSSLGSNVVILPTETTDFCSITLQGNTFSGNASNALYLHTSGAFTTLETTLSENTISDNEGSGLVLGTPVDILTLVVTGNTIVGGNNNGIGIIAAGSTSTGNITINNNTITDIRNASNGIAVSQDFSTLNLTIMDNTIDECEGSGILSYAPTGIDSLTLNISGNTISHCENLGSGNASSAISFDNYLNLTATVENNTFSDNTAPSVAFGFYSSGNPNACVNLSGNQCNTDLMDPSYSLTNPGSGIFNLSPCNVDSVNVGTIDMSGTIELVQSCPDATPCP